MRIRRGQVARKRHRKILKWAKTFSGRHSVSFRAANQQKIKALKYAYKDRRLKKRALRRLWIARANAFVRKWCWNYSQFMYQLEIWDIELNRKWLSQLAVRDDYSVDQLVALIS